MFIKWSNFSKNLFLLIKLSACYLFLTSQQNPVFQEKNIDISDYFKTPEVIKNEIMEDKYSQFHRKEGFKISEILKKGAQLTQELHKSGEINFNSEATEYINNIKNYLLRDYPKAKEDINVFITYNSSVNAFAAANRSIYFNIGLLSLVENEAQLAFILAHEIMHIVNYHIINLNIELKEKLNTIDKSDMTLDQEFRELTYHQMSQINEYEADLDGLNLYLTSDYSSEESGNALRILNKSYTEDSSPRKLLYLDDFEYKDIKTKLKVSDAKKRNTEKKLTTHPNLLKRIDTIAFRTKNFTSTTKSTTDFIISEESFNKIKAAASHLLEKSFYKDFDFIRGFINSSRSINEENDNQKESVQDLGYSLFGLVVDKLNKVDLNMREDYSFADSILTEFYNRASLATLTEWALNTLDSIHSKTEFQEIKIYQGYIAGAIKSKRNNSTLNQIISPYVTNEKKQSGLSLNNIDFVISPYTTIGRKELNSFNQSDVYEKEVNGKVAFLNLVNYSFKVNYKKALAELEREKMEQTHIRSVEAIRKIQLDRPTDFISVMPNVDEYYGSEYDKYVILNNWLKERLYFDGFNYPSVYKDDINEFRETTNITHFMTGIMVQMRSLNTTFFTGAWLSPILLPHYLPQIVSALIIKGSRTYQLTLVFDIETGELALYDKRTSLEPLTNAQVYLNYNDILNKIK
jgi:hypothetical protein